MKEVRAVVLGLIVVILGALALSMWQRPAREFHRVRGYRVEIRKAENGGSRHVAFTVPISLVARMASLVPVSDIGGNMRADFGDGEITARDILEAGNASSPGKPGVITRGHAHIEVLSEGAVLDIQAKDDWDKNVHIRVPRALVESLSKESRVSPKDILRRLDELGPGDIVSIKDRDNDVTITAQGK
ncbi:MAG: hypothetical protein LC780_12710 [Acidobacteria bacterium]|nr:hypothetical protein [Acidobacteriota bacterium]